MTTTTAKPIFRASAIATAGAMLLFFNVDAAGQPDMIRCTRPTDHAATNGCFAAGERQADGAGWLLCHCALRPHTEQPKARTTLRLGGLRSIRRLMFHCQHREDRRHPVEHEAGKNANITDIANGMIMNTFACTGRRRRSACTVRTSPPLRSPQHWKYGSRDDRSLIQSMRAPGASRRFRAAPSRR